ncbi:MAG TPA: S26 family signal peptidase [Candidatus Saccharimonadales bacterium]
MKSLKFSLQPSRRPNKRSFLLLRQVSGDSMLPALRPGFPVIATGHYKTLVVGDVVIIHHGGLEKIKRIVDIRKDRLFVRGDNQAHSTDSRSFGWLHASVVVAKVLWPRC